MEDYVGLCARLQGYADWMDQSVDDYVDEVKDLHLAINSIEQQAQEIAELRKYIASLEQVKRGIPSAVVAVMQDGFREQIVVLKAEVETLRADLHNVRLGYKDTP